MLTLFHLEFLLRVLEKTFIWKKYDYHWCEFRTSDGTLINAKLIVSANIVRS